MMILRIGGGVLAAAVVGMLVGAARDYLLLKQFITDEPSSMAWPLLGAVSAALGAIVMAIIKPSQAGTSSPRQSKGTQKPAAKVRTASAGQQRAEPEESSSVPGMPTFDFTAPSEDINGVPKTQHAAEGPEEKR
jgi:hypothetical protein